MQDFADQNINISIFGYPKDQVIILPFKTKNYQQYGHRGQIKHFEKGVLYHTIDTVGQTGSPILANVKGAQYVIGIHKAALKGKQVNVGCLFTAQTVQILE